jgi:predicted lipoprotein with Yx(FWY)xxD motif
MGEQSMQALLPLSAMTILTLSLSSALAMTASPAKVEKTSIGTVLANQKGMTLYTFTKDKTDKSECTGKCAVFWPPFTAPANANSRGNWTVITRPNGEKQWAYDGKPLYTFVKDKKPGQDEGNGIRHFGGYWEVAHPTG